MIALYTTNDAAGDEGEGGLDGQTRKMLERSSGTLLAGMEEV
jgi:hypothetical protein